MNKINLEMSHSSSCIEHTRCDAAAEASAYYAAEFKVSSANRHMDTIRPLNIFPAL